LDAFGKIAGAVGTTLGGALVEFAGRKDFPEVGEGSEKGCCPEKGFAVALDFGMRNSGEAKDSAENALV
jgi:hypothetical protein